MRCVGGLSAGRRKIAPHGGRQCRKSCPLLPLAVAELRSSRVAGATSRPDALGMLMNGRQKILSLSLARAFCLWKKEIRGGGTASSGPNQAENRVFSVKRRVVWFETPSVSNGKCFSRMGGGALIRQPALRLLSNASAAGFFYAPDSASSRQEERLHSFRPLA